MSPNAVRSLLALPTLIDKQFRVSLLHLKASCMYSRVLRRGDFVSVAHVLETVTQ